MTVEQDAIRLVRPASPTDQAELPKGMSRYVQAEELPLRNAVEAWGRQRWPDARVVHELVMDRGQVRLDVGFVCPAWLAVVEVKSGYDSTERLMHQVGLGRLCANEVWVAADMRHRRDVELMQHLLPSVGHLDCQVEIHARRREQEPLQLTERQVPRGTLAPVPEMMLALCWVAELRAISERKRVPHGKRATHAAMIRELAQVLSAEEVTAEVCRELRARDCLWRADPPIPIPATAAELVQ